jgi:hypothetical protein
MDKKERRRITIEVKKERRRSMGDARKYNNTAFAVKGAREAANRFNTNKAVILEDIPEIVSVVAEDDDMSQGCEELRAAELSDRANSRTVGNLHEIPEEDEPNEALGRPERFKS